MRRTVVSYSFAVLVAAIAIAAIFVGRAAAPSTVDGAKGFYLDIGASAALGTQPNGIAAHNGSRTKKGYSDDLVRLESANGIALTMREIGCPGETVQSMLGRVKNACYTLPNTQLSIASDYFRAHRGEIGVVTIDLGFNNVRACLTRTLTEESCVSQGIAAVREDLPTIVKRLQQVAGPQVHFVGLEYGDPFLAYYLDGSSGRVIAQQGLVAINQLNSVLDAVYRANAVSVANVPGAYKSGSLRPVRIAKVGTVPEGVARACALTWMCTPPPFGPDDHPNNAGYLTIARTLVAQLPRSW